MTTNGADGQKEVMRNAEESFKKSLRLALYGAAGKLRNPRRANDYGAGQAEFPIFENANDIMRALPLIPTIL